MDTGKVALMFAHKTPDPFPVIVLKGLLPPIPRMEGECRLFDLRKAGLQSSLEVRRNSMTLCQAHFGVKTQVRFDSHVSSVTRGSEASHLADSLVLEKFIAH